MAFLDVRHVPQARTHWLVPYVRCVRLGLIVCLLVQVAALYVPVDLICRLLEHHHALYVPPAHLAAA